MNVLSKPPLNFGERFQDVYEVILILDDREQFATRGSVSFEFVSPSYLLLSSLASCTMHFALLCF